MTVFCSDTFTRQYRRLPLNICKKVDRQLMRLAHDLRHPGLYAKKVTGYENIWEARVDYHHRLTFQIVGQTVLVRKVGPHDILRSP